MLSAVVVTVTASLVVQIAVLFLLTFGFMLKRKFRYLQHGFVMAAAVFIHLLMVFVLMIPSFVLAVVPDFIVISPLELTSIVGLIHGVLGSVSIVLGVWLVAAWRFKRDFNGCFARKRLMTPTLAVWVTALVFGVALYGIFLGPLLAA